MAASRLRKDPQQARSRRTVDAILEAADRVLRTDGYEAASTNRLARVAGFSVGSLYQYFDDKESVVGELLDRALADEAEELEKHLEQRAGRPLAELLGALTEFAVQGRWARAHLFQTLEQHAEQLIEGDPMSYGARGAMASPVLHRSLAPCLARGRPGAPIDEMVFVIAHVANAASMAFVVDRPPGASAGDLVDRLTACLLRYAGAGTRASTAPSEPLCTLLGRWMPDPDAAVSARAPRAARLQEARSALLRSAPVPEPLEPAVYVLAAVSDAAHEARELPPGLDAKVVAGELARLAAGCIAPDA